MYGLPTVNELQHLLMPFGILLLVFISLLARHQRKMAAIIHGSNSNPNSDQTVQQLVAEVQVLRSEMNRMHERMAQLALSSGGQSFPLNAPVVPQEMEPRV